MEFAFFFNYYPLKLHHIQISLKSLCSLPSANKHSADAALFLIPGKEDTDNLDPRLVLPFFRSKVGASFKSVEENGLMLQTKIVVETSDEKSSKTDELFLEKSSKPLER